MGKQEEGTILLQPSNWFTATLTCGSEAPNATRVGCEQSRSGAADVTRGRLMVLVQFIGQTHILLHAMSRRGEILAKLISPSPLADTVVGPCTVLPAP